MIDDYMPGVLASLPPELRARVEERARVMLHAMDAEGILPPGPIRTAWAVYAAGANFPEDYPDAIRALRRAFYAGASGVFDVLMHDLDPGREPTDADERKLAHMTNELDHACRAIARGTL